jgi:radical SAM protein with 4Fe4S-binding SPASM domain
MPVFLQPDVDVVVRDNNILLERRGVCVSHVIGIAEAIALAWLASTGDVESASTGCASYLADADVWVRRTVDRYWTYLGDGPARPVDLEWLVDVSRLRPVFPILPHSCIKQEAAPASITWMVTLGCNRNCPYCFFNIYHFGAGSSLSPPDATFPLDDAVRMVHEMARIGAADLYLTGGEPFLRLDIPEIIAEASRVRVRTHAVTKSLVSPDFACRIFEAGISSITVSLDDDRPREAAALAGAHGYLSEAEQTIEALLNAGVSVDVNAVVTKINAGRLAELAAHVAKLGVARLKLSPFHSPYPRRESAEKLLTPFALKDEVARIRNAALEWGLDVVLGEGADASDERKCGSPFVCEIGTRALDVLPDGSVSRCHYLNDVPEMKVANLRDHSLLEVWNSRSLISMTRPNRSVFSGTACSNCEQHDGCNARGRCYVSALQDTGRLHAPDAFCTLKAS